MKQYVIPGGVGILEYLQSKGVFVSAPCGGHGTCGKCRVKLLAGNIPPGTSDKALLTEEEISMGIRLACKAKPVTPVRVGVEKVLAGNMKTVTAAPDDSHSINKDASFTVSDGMAKSGREGKHNSVYGIAIDLGTTTLAASLVDMTTKNTLLTRTAINRQSIFGADVITRMESALSGKAEDLKRIIEGDILDLVASLGLSPGDNVNDMVIAGNTVMYHLLMEYDVSGLSRYPFTPVSLGGELFTRDEVFSYETEKRKLLPPDCRIKLIPGFSAFVGGDIASGIIACELLKLSGNAFFIDIGTNAEMVLKKGSELITASAAAGPALEGGNLKCGTGSVPGAICKVEPAEVADPGDSQAKINVFTIDEAPPIGICGTGAVEAVQAFLNAGIINEYGTFAQEYLESGFVLAVSPMGDMIGLDQDDIRQLQMAKAAIRAGAEVLLKASDISSGELDAVFISGGFGSFLDIGKAADIGMLPEGFEKKAKAVGNTSLKGAQKVLLEGIGNTAHVSTYELATDEVFKEKYIEYMNFNHKELT